MLFSPIALCGRHAYETFKNMTPTEKDVAYPGHFGLYVGGDEAVETELSKLFGGADRRDKRKYFDVSACFNLFAEGWIRKVATVLHTGYENAYEAELASERLRSGNPNLMIPTLQDKFDELTSDSDFSKMFDDEHNYTLWSLYKIKMLIRNHVKPHTLICVLRVAIALHEGYLKDVNSMVTCHDGDKGDTLFYEYCTL